MALGAIFKHPVGKGTANVAIKLIRVNSTFGESLHWQADWLSFG